MDIKLNVINRSNDQNNSEIVIFQKNVATDFDEIAVAWTVIQNLGQGFHHPFVYPMDAQLAFSDSWGNYSPSVNAEPGQQFSACHAVSGDALRLTGEASSPLEYALLNELPAGSINALIFKDGRLLASKTSLAPQQKAVFQFEPKLWIGVASQVEQGQVMNSAIVSSINTEISLLGIASADIVMTGGGAGPSSEPFEFTLQNVVMA